MLFDGYMAVDWSAAGTPKRGPDSIWIAATGWGGGEVLENPATRGEAMARVEEILAAARAAGRRMLCGFDFPFGYPAGAARALTGRDDWAALWALIAGTVNEGPGNANNRFDAAAVLNRAFPGEGPFWGNGLKRDIEGLPRKKPSGWGESLPRNRRHAEVMVTGAQEVWKLSGVGSVGGQALTGIAALERLRHRAGAEVWPFETLGEGRAPVLAEIYPSLLHPEPHGVKDAGQVLAVVRSLAAHDASGALAGFLEAPGAMSAAVRREEAVILGQDDVPLFSGTIAGGQPPAPPGIFPETGRGWLRDPKAIYAESFAIVRREARFGDMPEDVAEVAVRLVHACGMTDVAECLRYSADVVTAARTALSGGAPILCDCTMVASGIISRGLPAGNERLCMLGDPRVPGLAAEAATTRSAAAVDLWRERMGGAVVAIGNAPTALFRLLELIDEGAPRPAAIFGFPVGFVGAAESKAALAADPRGVPFLTLPGRRGGSAMAAAAVNGAALGLRGDGT